MLRSSPERSHSKPVRGRGNIIEDGNDWVTLREACEATGVPTSTIRKWARHENIPSFLEKTTDGYLRLVSMRGIRLWAGEIGRDLEAGHETSSHATAEVDLTEADTEDGGTVVPEGSMIVPLDAWNRMLNQLGNLHEAGQQLAEARERAAKAETEARFLKERLADLREELEKTKAEPSPASSPEATGEEISGAASPMSIAKTLYDSWRMRRRQRR